MIVSIVMNIQVAQLTSEAQLLWACILLTWVAIDSVLFSTSFVLVGDIIIPLLHLITIRTVVLFLQRAAQVYSIHKSKPLHSSAAAKSRMPAIVHDFNQGCTSQVLNGIVEWTVLCPSSFISVDSLVKKNLEINLEIRNTSNLDSPVKSYYSSIGNNLS